MSELVFLSKEETVEIKKICEDRISFFSHQYHSLEGSRARLGTTIRNYAEWTKKEQKKMEDQCKFWEKLKRKLG